VAEVEVLHRWAADQGRRINGIPARRDGGDVDLGIVVGERVEAGVVAEGALEDQLLCRIDVALQDQLGLGGHVQV
jgi:hypothetical protein